MGKRSVVRTVSRVIGIVAACAVCLVLVLLAVLSFAEYKPAATERVSSAGTATKLLKPGDTFTVLTWNTGYGALGSNADFFMDGGTHVATADRLRVEQNLSHMQSVIAGLSPDVVFLQEVDVRASRSHRIDEAASFASSLGAYQTAFARNFKVLYIPYPVPPMGTVDAGIMTASSFPVTDSVRVQLPCPFSWPYRICNLKRCLLVSRVRVGDAGRELVLVNLHLEAYDSGEGKRAQTEQLRDLLVSERAKGNYVVSGGDFNQTFSSADISSYPVQEGLWKPGVIDVSDFGEGFRFVMDTAVPSCRSLDRPYDGADPSQFQFYAIDGFIVSDNLTVLDARTVDDSFAATDHNPVLLTLEARE